MIDFDLEAPGLTFLASGKAPAGTPSVKPGDGLVELVLQVREQPSESDLLDPAGVDRFRTRYLVTLPTPEGSAPDGVLDLLRAGRLDGGYEDRLYRIDFNELYRSGTGEPFFKHFRAYLRALRPAYDYVLIDSRTGFSDEGGICTRDLADRLVLVTGLNHQNVEGTKRWLLRALEGGAPLAGLTLVFSPIPVGYEELRRPREDDLIREVQQATGSVPSVLRLPYHPRIALDEGALDFDWTDTELGRAYIDLAMTARRLVDDTPSDAAQEMLDLLDRDELESAVSIGLNLHVEDPELLELVVSSWTGPRQDPIVTRRTVLPFLERLASRLPGVMALTERLADAYDAVGDFARAAELYAECLQTYSDESHPRYVEMLCRLAEIAASLGDVNEAVRRATFALAVAEAAELPWLERRAIGVLIDVYVATGRFQSAVEVVEAGRRRRPDGDFSLELGAGDIAFARGRFLEAADSYNQALATGFGGDFSEVVAEASWRLSRTCLELGELRRGATFADQALRSAEGRANPFLVGTCHLAKARVAVENGDLRQMDAELVAARSQLTESRNAASGTEVDYLAYLLDDTRGQHEDAYHELLELGAWSIRRRRPLDALRMDFAAAVAARHAQRFDAALDLCERVHRRARTLRVPHRAALVISEMGYLRVLAGGEADGGIRDIERARRVFASLNQTGRSLKTTIRLADAMCRSGRHDDAMAELEPFQRFNAGLGRLAFNEARIVRAKCGMSSGLTTAGRRLLEQAVEFAREHEIAKPLFVEAEELLRRGTGSRE